LVPERRTAAHPVVADANVLARTTSPETRCGAPDADTWIGAASAGIARHVPVVGMCAHPLPPDPLLNILTRHGPRTVTGAVRGPQAERLEVRRSEFEKRAGCGERRRVIENAGASGEEVLHHYDDQSADDTQAVLTF
jgi:hypothetical protein